MTNNDTNNTNGNDHNDDNDNKRPSRGLRSMWMQSNDARGTISERGVTRNRK